MITILLAALLTLLGDAGPGTLAPEPWEMIATKVYVMYLPSVVGVE